MGSCDPSKIDTSYIDASHSRQPLVKGERLVRYEVNVGLRSVTRKMRINASFPDCALARWLQESIGIYCSTSSGNRKRSCKLARPTPYQVECANPFCSPQSCCADRCKSVFGMGALGKAIDRVASKKYNGEKTKHRECSYTSVALSP